MAQLKFSEEKGWKKYLRPSVFTMLFFGFSAGIPILLIFSSLSIWLREAGVDRASVTFFSWAALGYSFKFVWAPLIDRLPLPFLTRILGKRRSWILFSQIAIMISILIMALTDPSQSDKNLTIMAIGAVLLGFSSATQDIVIDAYRIESDVPEMQALLSSTYIAGYRIAMIVAGAGALYLASFFGTSKENYSYQSWMWTYAIMSLTMLVGLITTLLVKEPTHKVSTQTFYSNKDYSGFFVFFLIVTSSFVITFYLSSFFTSHFFVSILGNGLGGFLFESIRMITALSVAVLVALAVLKTPLINKQMAQDTYVAPVKDFFDQHGKSVSILLLSLIGLYRISDIVLGTISNVFYQDLGFTNEEIASVVKTFGLIMTLFGGFLGGILTVRFGIMKVLMLGALLSALTNILFMNLASMGNNLYMLYFVISADNIAGGLASAAFIAFLSGLTNVSFTAIQYAIFSSLMTLTPKIIGGYSGTMVDALGYHLFFAFSAAIGLPVLVLVWLADKKLKLESKNK